MANVAHASLTGAELHEPKGISTAALGEVYVANGSGSGSWANVGTSSFTGMIADFTTPVVPSGWLECDGSVVSTTTYAALYGVMTVQTSGTRISANPIITSISSTASMRAGYYVFGTGISAGTTILTVDSANQITLSAGAGSSGTDTIIVSPWLVAAGTIKLPDVSTAGRYRRSRTTSTAVGQVQADQNKAHTHNLSGSTVAEPNHTHINTLTDPGHTHVYSVHTSTLNAGAGAPTTYVDSAPGSVAPNTISNTTGVTINNVAAGGHSHSLTGATAATDGGTEVRPLSIIVMTCVKT